MTGASDLARMVPGFDFLQGLLKNAGAGLPPMGQWVAPTLNPEELEKRIQELKTVQFWLEQNARLLATTIQALEVQRMTLSTLQSMNVPLADLGQALKIKPMFGGAATAAAPAPASTESAAGGSRDDTDSQVAPAPRASAKARAAKTRASAPPAVDPMQWWGALTQQFTELATKAVQDTAADASRQMASAMVKQSIDSAGGMLKKAAQAASDVAKAAASSAVGSDSGAIPKASKRATAQTPTVARPRVGAAAKQRRKPAP
jgi:hypothetical protein